jgi:hypothetical protein
MVIVMSRLRAFPCLPLALLMLMCLLSVRAHTEVLWSAGHESGDMSEWYKNDRGGEFNSGNAVSGASQDFAHTGRYSAKMTIDTPSTAGVRLFRWEESQNYPQLYYSVWFYIPRQYFADAGWWNIFQWKSHRPGQNDPFFVIDAMNRNGKSYLSLFEWQPGRRIRYQPLAQVTIPIGKWFQVEAYYKCSSDNTGQVIIWQDSVKLYDVSGVKTRFSDGDCQWSVNNYSDRVSLSPTTIYADDAVISTTRVGAVSSGGGPAPARGEKAGPGLPE